MDRSVLKWLLLGLAALLFFRYGMPAITGKGDTERQPLTINDSTAPAERAPEETCQIRTSLFDAELSTRGGALKHMRMLAPKYQRDKQPVDVVSTTLESRMPLRTDLRMPGPDGQQVTYDDFDWKLAAHDDKSCTFSYADDATKLTKTITATDKPYELRVSLKVENLAAEPRKHRLTVEQTAWRTKKETESSLGRMSEFMTETVVATDQKTERHGPGDFKPGDFKDKEFTAEKWRQTPGNAQFASVSSSYFSEIVIPEAGPPPAAETQVEEVWDPARFPKKTDDPQYGHIYRARLAYPEAQLAPHGSTTYEMLAFVGPKERALLAALDHHANEVIDLGWFSPIAKVLVSYLYVLKGFIGSWGWAICLLTLSVRLLLLPLTLSQVKTSIAMRRLKPEMDALNAKYKDDATQKGLALQELWRKNNVQNPILGCFPVVLQMPVWFALYRALQTAVELYHEPFGPFIPDLSAPGKYFIIPIVLGASSFLQQKIMPPQGDPAQQKMMQYLVPGMFTAMMLFLPAGLGVYMLTSTWLGIAQQLVMERYLKTKAGPSATIEVRDKTPGPESPSGAKSAALLGKERARVRG